MKPARLQRLRHLLWLYFWLLIFEGALRKWLFPGLSNLLLVVRDPVALLALWFGLPLLLKRRFRLWIQVLYGIGLLAFIAALGAGHGDWVTAAFGTRILLIQLPLIFLYATAFDRNGVMRFAQALLLISIPMTLLIVVQSNLPASHVLNVAPGGEDTATFVGALDRFRPPGMFTFINGLAFFYGLAAAALFLRLYGGPSSPFGRLLILAAGIALVVAVPVSISRLLLFGYAMVLLAVFGALLLSRNRLVPLISGVLVLLLTIGIGTSVPAFQDTTDAFRARWEDANSIEGGQQGALGVFQLRVLGDFTSAFARLDRTPLLGFGIGLGTNVGSQRLTGGLSFLIAEGSWEATVGELGLFLGPAFLFWRLALGWALLRLSIRSAIKGNRLPMILLGASLLAVISGNTSQPTTLGFLVVSAGLTWAAANPAPLVSSSGAAGAF